ncbi:hypothetical protein [Streptomyces sp. NPDC050287]|uniref:hypothetical protein n=1 Tax=Streptomyces sp. NPDC050287 TaxID=3365608 RepID=UPI0037AFCAA2
MTGEGDAVGDFGYTPGHHIGYVEGSANGAIPAETSLYDAELVDVGYGADQYVNSDEADQPSGRWYPVTSSAY